MNRTIYRVLSGVVLLSGIIAWIAIFVICSTSWYKNIVTYEYAVSYQDKLMNPIDAAITACVLIPTALFDIIVWFKMRNAGEQIKAVSAGIVLFMLITAALLIVEQIGRTR